MLRTVNAQPTLWEALLPEMRLGLPAELEAVDRPLDDPVFFAPYRRHFHPIFGRPSVPIDLSATHVLEIRLQARLRAALS
jgi:IS5 family transposase